MAGILLCDESATPLKITGVVIGFAGVIVMMDLSSIATSSLLAQLAILAAQALEKGLINAQGIDSDIDYITRNR